jgi:hypothetical protein
VPYFGRELLAAGKLAGQRQPPKNLDLHRRIEGLGFQGSVQGPALAGLDIMTRYPRQEPASQASVTRNRVAPRLGCGCGHRPVKPRGQFRVWLARALERRGAGQAAAGVRCSVPPGCRRSCSVATDWGVGRLKRS